MSVVLQNCAGTIHVFGSGTSGSSGLGLFKLSPAIPSHPPNSMCFIDSIPTSAREIVQPVVTLDDKRFLYVFGRAWTEATITGRLLLGKHGNQAIQLGSLLDWYKKNRVGTSKAAIKASAGNIPLVAYVCGLQAGTPDPNTYVQPFTINAVVNLDI